MEEQPGIGEDPAAPRVAEAEPPPPPAPPSQPPYVTPPPHPPSPRHRYRGGWMFAVIIIIVGVVFLIKNLGWVGDDWRFDNWWALFIFIPAIGSFGNAWNSYLAAGRQFDSATGRSLMFGVLFVAIAIVFLLELDWGKLWPVVLIIIGVGMILGWHRNRT